LLRLGVALLIIAKRAAAASKDGCVLSLGFSDTG